jgi:SAM-dependent methyltransferase
MQWCARMSGAVDVAAERLDRAGKAHWDRMWESEGWPDDVDPHSLSVWGHRDRLLHQTFQKILRGRPPGSKVLELGCARSAWLPYLAREFGFSLFGLDYSELGAAQAAERLRRCGLPAEIRCADLFAPPADWMGAFDLVVWFGVAEHFEDTTAAIRAASRYLKPGGLMITEIPNMSGAVGWLQRWANKPIYDIHVPLTVPQLTTHHERAGLHVVAATYVVPTDFGIVDPEGIPDGVIGSIKRGILYGFRLLTGVVWWLDARLGPIPVRRLLSGFVVVAAERPTSGV